MYLASKLKAKKPGATMQGGATFVMGSANVTLYAIWGTPYTVTYNANGATSGNVPLDSNVYAAGVTVTVLGNTGSLALANYIFAGWNTLANGSGTGYAAGQTFTMGSANVNLYAVWKPAYTVTYNANGTLSSGSVPSPANYMQGATVTVSGNTGGMTMSGYVFAGWTTCSGTASTGTSYNNSGTVTFTMGSANVTLYAVWIPSNLTFTSSGNSITITGYTTAPAGSLSIPVGVTGITGTGAAGTGFYDCTGLTSVAIPSSVTSIGSYAFEYCVGLTSVTIPSSVTSIGAMAFYNCSSLTSITVASGNPDYQSDSSGVLFNLGETTLIAAPGKLTGSYTIPSSVTSIGQYAFFGCTGLTSVTIPSSVTSIGSYAFSNCTGLTGVTIPSSVIGQYAFFACTGLTSITITSTVSSIGQYAFFDCTGLTGTLTIPSGVNIIGAGTFQGCSRLTSIIIPSSVTSIGLYAFGDCSDLTSITVASGNPDYQSDSSGVLFNLGETTLIQAPCGFTGSYTIPSSVTSIGAYAFQLCKGLTVVTIPSSVASIGTSAFNQCSGLASVTFIGANCSIAGSTVFESDNSSLTIYAPTGGTVQTYCTTSPESGWIIFN
jgi:uncharacterized repeat protein (TIGR02543 family)